MKNIVIIVTLLFLATSCRVKLNSISNAHLNTKKYQKPLIVIPYAKRRAKNFSLTLIGSLNSEFSKNNQKVKVLGIEIPKKLDIPEEDLINQKIQQSLSSEFCDVILFFNLTDMFYYNGSLSSVTYEINGIDTISKKEIWKAKYDCFGSSLGPIRNGWTFGKKNICSFKGR